MPSKDRLKKQRERSQSRESTRRNRESNPEVAKDKRRQEMERTRSADPEKAKEKSRQEMSKTRAADPEKAKKNWRQEKIKSRSADPEKAKEKSRQEMSKTRAADPEKAKKNWRQEKIKSRSAETAEEQYDFLHVPTSETIESCIGEYVKRMMDSEVVGVCCSCGIRVSIHHHHQVTEEDFMLWKKSDSQHALSVPMGIGQKLIDADPDSFHEGLLLSSEGIVVDREKGCKIFSLCTECNGIRTNPRAKEKIPAKSLANGNYYGPVPVALQNLTLAEEILISKARIVTTIVNLSPIAGIAQKCLKGNACSVNQPVPEIAEILPRSIESLPEHLQVCFTGPRRPTKQDLKSLFRVRRIKVANALEHLYPNEPSIISQDILATLPIDDVPDLLINSVRIINDEKLIDANQAEHDSYAPRFPTNHEHEDDQDDAIIPIDFSGMIDVEHSDVTEKEKQIGGICRVLQSSNEILHVPTTKSALNEYHNHLLWYHTFPTLFPNNVGAPEGNNPQRHVKLAIETWFKHALLLADPRFRQHRTFMIYVYNALNRRAVSSRASLKVKHGKLDKDADHLVHSITSKDLKDAAQKLAKGEYLVNDSIKKFLDMVSATAGYIPGTPYAMKVIRQEIMSQQAYLGLPTFFLTINPHDIDSRIVCHLGGGIPSLTVPFLELPGFRQRAQVAAQDPTACALFFDFCIRSCMDILLGCSKGVAGQVKTNHGILGKVSAYYGTVETQGRGTLHYHALVWLENWPALDEFRSKLDDESFKQRFIAYIDAIIKAGYPNVPDNIATENQNQTVTNIPRHEVQLSSEHFLTDIYSMCKSRLNHSCTFTCFKHGKKCRFGFGVEGKPLTPETTISANGEVSIKRTHPHINSYNEAVLYCVRSNMDIKYIASGKDAKSLTCYITDYITKGNMKTHDVVGIMATVRERDEKGNPEPLNAAKRNAVRCLNQINVKEGISAPMIALLSITGIDHYKSHKFTPVYIGPIIKDVKAKETIENDLDFETEDIDAFNVLIEDEKVITVMQKHDYYFRSQELMDICLYQYFSEYEKCPKQKTVDSKGGLKKGRTPLPRWSFQNNHPQFHTHEIKKRSNPTVPSLSFFPRDKDKNPEEFAMYMLALLKPFTLPTELKMNKESFVEAFESTDFSDYSTSIMSHLLDMNTGRREQQEDRDRRKDEESEKSNETATDDTAAGAIRDDPRDEFVLLNNEDDDFDVEALLDNENSVTLKKKPQQAKYVQDGISAANIKSESSSEKKDVSCIKKINDNGINELRNALKVLQTEIDSASKVDATHPDPPSSPKIFVPDDITEPKTPETAILKFVPTSEQSKLQKSLIEKYTLNSEQIRAFLIVTDHVHETINEHSPPQLLMLVRGEGGTGKSRIISCVTEYFEHTKSGHMLKRCAPTGKAASLISGTTIHSLLGLSVRGKSAPVRDGDLLEKKWGSVSYVICDEVSMIGQMRLSQMSSLLNKAKHCAAEVPFGGVNMIFFGDFKQFKPVADYPLFSPNLTIRKDHKTMQAVKPPVIQKVLGRNLWLQVDTVVTLTEQMRAAEDEEYRSMLRRVQNGEGSNDDYQRLKSRIVGNGAISLNSDPFKRCPIIVSRNELRVRINQEILTAFSEEKALCIVSWLSEDKYDKKIADEMHPSLRAEINSLTDSQTENLSRKLSLCVGANVRITKNISVNLKLANGSMGTVVEVIPDSRDTIPSVEKCGKIQLNHVPKCVMVKVLNGNIQLPGYPQNVIPIFPVDGSFRHVVKRRGNEKNLIINVRRKQIPLRLNWCVTNYDCQGSTYEHCVVDLAVPPDLKHLTTEFANVPLSRTKSYKRLAILRDFPIQVLKATPIQEIVVEEKRLDELTANTKKHFVISLREDLLESLEKMHISPASTIRAPVRRKILRDTPSPAAQKPKLCIPAKSADTVPKEKTVRELSYESGSAISYHEAPTSITIRTPTRNAIDKLFDDSWLDDTVMDFIEKSCQEYMNSPCVQFQQGFASFVPNGYPPCLAKELNNENGCVHIIHVLNHWVCVRWRPGTYPELTLFDSMGETRNLSQITKIALRQLFPQLHKIRIADSNVQPNGYDCGPYAIANAVAIALGQDPTRTQFQNVRLNAVDRPINTMRNAVWEIIRKKELIPFQGVPRKPRDGIDCAF